MLRKRDCRHIEPLLWGYAQGRLKQGEEERVDAHLILCPSCRAQASAYRQTAEGIAALRSRPLPASQANWQDVRGALAVLPAPHTAARRGAVLAWPFPALPRRAWAGVGAAAVLCLLFAARSVREAAPTTPLLSAARPNASLVTAAPDKTSAPLPAGDALKTSAAKGAIRMKTAALWNAAAPETRREPAHSFVKTAPSFVRTAHRNRRRTKRGHWLLAANRQAGNQPSAALVDNTSDVAGNAVGLLAQNLNSSNRQMAPEPQDAPEYVLTVVEGSGASPRDYVIDGVSGEASRAPHEGSNSTTKEIRAW